MRAKLEQAALDAWWLALGETDLDLDTPQKEPADSDMLATHGHTVHRSVLASLRPCVVFMHIYIIYTYIYLYIDPIMESVLVSLRILKK